MKHTDKINLSNEQLTELKKCSKNKKMKKTLLKKIDRNSLNKICEIIGLSNNFKNKDMLLDNLLKFQSNITEEKIKIIS